MTTNDMLKKAAECRLSASVTKDATAKAAFLRAAETWDALAHGVDLTTMSAVAPPTRRLASMAEGA